MLRPFERSTGYFALVVASFWTDELRRSDTLLYGRVTYELMEGA